MLSLNKYMQEKYPDIFKEYEKYRKAEEKKEKNAPHCDYSPVENCPGLWTKNK